MIGIYAHVSTDDQADKGYSLPDQSPGDVKRYHDKHEGMNCAIEMYVKGEKRRKDMQGNKNRSFVTVSSYC